MTEHEELPLPSLDTNMMGIESIDLFKSLEMIVKKGSEALSDKTVKDNLTKYLIHHMTVTIPTDLFQYKDKDDDIKEYQLKINKLGQLLENNFLSKGTLPFTIVRICELCFDPFKYFKVYDFKKFVNSIERCCMVRSKWEPFEEIDNGFTNCNKTNQRSKGGKKLNTDVSLVKIPWMDDKKVKNIAPLVKELDSIISNTFGYDDEDEDEDEEDLDILPIEEDNYDDTTTNMVENTANNNKNDEHPDMSSNYSLLSDNLGVNKKESNTFNTQNPGLLSGSFEEVNYLNNYNFEQYLDETDEDDEDYTENGIEDMVSTDEDDDDEFIEDDDEEDAESLIIDRERTPEDKYDMNININGTTELNNSSISKKRKNTELDDYKYEYNETDDNTNISSSQDISSSKEVTPKKPKNGNNNNVTVYESPIVVMSKNGLLSNTREEDEDVENNINTMLISPTPNNLKDKYDNIKESILSDEGKIMIKENIVDNDKDEFSSSPLNKMRKVIE